MTSFTINTRLPSLNEYIDKCRNNKYSAAKFKNEVETVIAYSIMTKRRDIYKACRHPVYIYFEWHEKSRRRDLDNVYSAKKYILDSMQRCEVLDNDSPRFVSGIYDGIVYDKTDKVIVYIYSQNEKEKLINKIMEGINYEQR